MDLGLRDRVYLVTGASRGLGRATAETLVREGARVVVSSRDAEAVARAANALGTAHAIGLAADNADPAAAVRLAATAFAKWGRLDGALISVGGPPAGSALDVDDGSWRDAFEAVFLGALRMVRAIVSATERSRSPADPVSIALVLSTSAREPIPGLGVSNGLRPGLAMVAKNLADELGPHGVRVNGLMPGRIETERVRELDALADDPEALRRDRESGIPLRRYGRPEEFGRVAAFVLCPAASYLTGAMVPVDGGATRSP